MNESIQSTPLASIDGAWLRDALLCGIQRVMSRRDYINKINVFPVADADTGTNLAFTLNAVVAGATQRVNRNVGEFMTLVADHALDGARGNSGAIFAQYLQGFSEVAMDRAVLSPDDYAAAAVEGAQSAQGAIAEPREGTMLSVIRDYAHELRDQIQNDVDDFRVLLSRGLKRARASLENTPNQLAVLKENGVVDAGAQGFVDLLEGIQQFVEGGDDARVELETLGFDEGDVPDVAAGHDGEVTHRFCTECMVTGESIDRRKLRERLQALDSSSLVIAGTLRKVRVHVHVNSPAEAFLVCEDFGEVSSQKADDMRQQQSTTHASGRRVAIVADTGADMPDSEMERLHVHLVPLRVNFGDRQFLDKVSLTPSQFYARVREAEVSPKTSQPPPGDYRRQFEFLSSHFESVICISVSSRVSGTWQAADSAAGRVDAEKIRVFDSLNASCGEGLLTMYAAEAAEAGLGADQVWAALERMRGRTRTFAVLRDLSYGVRGGRIPSWLKTVAEALRLTAVIATTPDGRVVPAGALLTRKHVVDRFAGWVTRRVDDDTPLRIMIGHCDALDDARDLRERLVSRLSSVHSVFLAEAGTAIGAHAGPGCLVVSVQQYESPRDWLKGTGATHG